MAVPKRKTSKARRDKKISEYEDESTGTFYLSAVPRAKASAQSLP